MTYPDLDVLVVTHHDRDLAPSLFAILGWHDEQKRRTRVFLYTQQGLIGGWGDLLIRALTADGVEVRVLTLPFDTPGIGSARAWAYRQYLREHRGDSRTLLLLDDDVYVSQVTVLGLDEALRRSDGCQAFSPMIRYPWRRGMLPSDAIATVRSDWVEVLWPMEQMWRRGGKAVQPVPSLPLMAVYLHVDTLALADMNLLDGWGVVGEDMVLSAQWRCCAVQSVYAWHVPQSERWELQALALVQREAHNFVKRAKDE